jgi:parallel beta-helix repeat protein
VPCERGVEMSRRLLALLVTSCVVGVGAAVISNPPADAGALPACPTVTTSTTLTGDCIGPLRVNANGITVDLGGFGVLDCVPIIGVDAGILVSGRTGVVVKNGTVTDCEAGVLLTTPLTGGPFGGNKVEKLTLTGHSVAGILLSGVRPNGNNQIISNTLQDNTLGIQALLMNPGNQIRSNTLTENGAAISLATTGNTVRNNNATQNLAGIVLVAAVGDSNVVQSNWAIANVLAGIAVGEGANSNTIRFNIAVLNLGVDLADDNANCDSNVWFFNIHLTRSQSCVR